MNSRLYVGSVRHSRHEPVVHSFDYRMFMLCLDLAELDEVFRGRWLWSTRRPALAWFRRRDHFGDPAVPLSKSVRGLVQERLGWRPEGPIRLLTHLRYFGYCMNPVSFYYCFDTAGDRTVAIVAEVHNTPWGERHCYVLDPAAGQTPPESDRPQARHRFQFDKAFHVSPFMAMDQGYDWRLSEPGPTLGVHMRNLQAGRSILEVTLSLRARPISGPSLAAALVRHPFMTGKVIAGIYLQAARLWWKRCPFHSHPKHDVLTKAS